MEAVVGYLIAENVSYFGASPTTRDKWAAVIDGGMASVMIAPGVVAM